MELRTLILIAAFMAFPAACLIYAWRKRSDFRRLTTWREKLLNFTFPLATASLLLISAFLVREWRWGGQSFVERPPQYWVTLNQISLLGVIIVFCMALLGKGKLRLPILLWSLSLPLLAFFVFMMGFSY